MFLTILDFREGEVKIIELPDETPETDTDDGAVIKRLGHTDYVYMTSKNLIMTIDNEC